jgi:hypothetical protein
MKKDKHNQERAIPVDIKRQYQYTPAINFFTDYLTPKTDTIIQIGGKE